MKRLRKVPISVRVPGSPIPTHIIYPVIALTLLISLWTRQKLVGNRTTRNFSSRLGVDAARHWGKNGVAGTLWRGIITQPMGARVYDTGWLEAVFRYTDSSKTRMHQKSAAGGAAMDRREFLAPAGKRSAHPARPGHESAANPGAATCIPADSRGRVQPGRMAPGIENPIAAPASRFEFKSVLSRPLPAGVRPWHGALARAGAMEALRLDALGQQR